MSPSKTEYCFLLNIIKTISSPLRIRQVCLQHIIIHWASLSLDFNCDAVPLCAGSTWFSSVLPHGSWGGGGGEGGKNNLYEHEAYAVGAVPEYIQFFLYVNQHFCAFYQHV